MNRILKLSTIMLSLVCLAGCASNYRLQAQEQQKRNTKNNSRTFHESNLENVNGMIDHLDKYAVNKNFCFLPINIAASGIITNAPASLARKGIAPGYVIHSLDNLQVSNADDIYSLLHEAYGAEDSVELFMSTYNGDPRSARVECLDGAKILGLMRKGIQAHNNKKWKDCKRLGSEYERARKLPSNGSTFLKSACFQQEFLSQGNNLTRQHVSLHYEHHRVGFDAIRYDIIGDYSFTQKTLVEFTNWARRTGAADIAQLAMTEFQQSVNQRQVHTNQSNNGSKNRTEIANAADLFERVSPAVYAVVTDKSTGSAVALSSNTLVTNCHVVDGATQILVIQGQTQIPAQISKAHKQKDICLMTTAVSGLQYASIGSSLGTKIGQEVFAVGAPRGLELTISEGLLSQKRSALEMMQVNDNYPILQISAPISPGSSGGGIFNNKGELVGITTFVLRDSQNLNFAMPIEWATN